ncbi:CapA family protein [Lactonifactor longoviformis]|uniref:CapA family protein n=1 Tax=Lactonifactor TaxID=420345 RepID=UPI0012AFD175|nr:MULTISPECIES: CapA family protein [Lactonifactor]MCQ4673114.1 CapA family protein [Lactonifactor longoviformis]MSA01343.1 hypothetical protein [Lactonifactor sp. BIOML-A5]MSA09519.1 hypothetical protein [Lactonifactor sp. BIOML-A4]MSA14037.1 hypothetical protein [Lactonifactor sp. BIOML-A3]MSA18003.1 hypothetical protein [Lactonifactor sp. BIOML-A2]
MKEVVRKSKYGNPRIRQQQRRALAVKMLKLFLAAGAGAMICFFFHFLRVNSMPGEPADGAVAAAKEYTDSITLRAIPSCSLEEEAAAKLKHLNLASEKGEIIITNLESVLTEEDLEKESKDAVKASPKQVELLHKGGINAVNLANSHSKGYGEEGYLDTVHHLTKSGITSFGYDRVTVKEVRGIKIAFTGIDAADGIPGSREAIKKNILAGRNMDAQLVILCINWGADNTEEQQRELGHAAIEEGADLVLGYHSEDLQEIENYKGKYIAYSLDHIRETETLEQTFIFQKGELESCSEAKIISRSAVQS